MKRKKRHTKLTLALILGGLTQAAAHGADLIPLPEEIFDNSLQSVVELKADTADVGESFGTAVFVKDDGTLVTNAHVVTYKEGGETYSFENLQIRFSFEENTLRSE